MDVDDKVLRWRAERLSDAGFTDLQASWLAICKSVDLHDAIALLERGLAAGATPEVIFDVLAE
jgi:hypothetical protein